MEKRPFWQDGLSSDETKVSALVVAFLATTIVALWSYIKRDSIGPEMVLLLQTMMTAITGLNVTKHIMDRLSAKKDKSKDVKDNTDIQNLPVEENPADIDKSRNMV